MTDLKFTSPSGETTIKLEGTGRLGTVAPKTQLHIKMDEPVQYKTPMTENEEEIEKVKAQIKVLEKKLSFLEELEKTKTPCEEAYKDWWGEYPETGTTASNNDDARWAGFQAGYEFAYAISTAKEVMEKVQEEQKEDIMWKPVALRFGEKLSDVGPDGYYNFTPEEWFDWVVNTYGKGQQIKDAVRESVKWCEENPDKSLEDYLTPKTPEQTEQSLKEAFVEAQKTEKWKEIQKLIDEEDNDKNFKNSLDLIKEWGEKNKPPTLYEKLEEWVDYGNFAQSRDVLVNEIVNIVKDWLPPSNDKNSYEWEKCLKMMYGNLR